MEFMGSSTMFDGEHSERVDEVHKTIDDVDLVEGECRIFKTHETCCNN